MRYIGLLTALLFCSSISGQASDSLKAKIEIFKDQLRESNPEHVDLMSKVELLRLYQAYSEDRLYAIVGKPLPFFSLEDEHGTKIVSDIFKGKPTVILFWDSYCQPCLDLIPIIVDINNRYTNTVNVITVTSDDIVDMSPYVDLHNFHIYHLFGSGDYNKELGINTLPKVLLLDRELILKKLVTQKDVRKKNDDLEFVLIQDLEKLLKI